MVGTNWFAKFGCGCELPSFYVSGACNFEEFQNFDIGRRWPVKSLLWTSCTRFRATIQYGGGLGLGKTLIDSHGKQTWIYYHQKEGFCKILKTARQNVTEFLTMILSLERALGVRFCKQVAATKAITIAPVLKVNSIKRWQKFNDRCINTTNF